MTTFCLVRRHPVLQLHQFALQPEQLLEVFLAVFLLVRIARTAVGQAGQRMVVLDVHLEFFVPAVHHVAADTGNQLLGVEGIGVHEGPDVRGAGNAGPLI